MRIIIGFLIIAFGFVSCSTVYQPKTVYTPTVDSTKKSEVKLIGGFDAIEIQGAKLLDDHNIVFLEYSYDFQNRGHYHNLGEFFSNKQYFGLGYGRKFDGNLGDHFLGASFGFTNRKNTSYYQGRYSGEGHSELNINNASHYNFRITYSYKFTPEFSFQITPFFDLCYAPYLSYGWSVTDYVWNNSLGYHVSPHKSLFGIVGLQGSFYPLKYVQASFGIKYPSFVRTGEYQKTYLNELSQDRYKNEYYNMFTHEIIYARAIIWLRFKN
ncbi:MAG: hypothetical protein ACPGLV_02500 [Bacteroidia bacterium]